MSCSPALTDNVVDQDELMERKNHVGDLVTTKTHLTWNEGTL